jgi:hypothetical protein
MQTWHNALAATILLGNTPGDLQTIPLREPFSVPCACLHKHTYASLRLNLSSTGKPTDVRVHASLWRMHAYLTTFRSRRASIAYLLLLYGMHSFAAFLSAKYALL